MCISNVFCFQCSIDTYILIVTIENFVSYRVIFDGTPYILFRFVSRNNNIWWYRLLIFAVLRYMERVGCSEVRNCIVLEEDNGFESYDSTIVVYLEAGDEEGSAEMSVDGELLIGEGGNVWGAEGSKTAVKVDDSDNDSEAYAAGGKGSKTKVKSDGTLSPRLSSKSI
jgi:hypothetical protein